MSVSSIRFPSNVIPLPEAPGVLLGRSWPRTLAAIAFLVALGTLMIGSLLASGDEWSLARSREHASPVAAPSGPDDPHC